MAELCGFLFNYVFMVFGSIGLGFMVWLCFHGGGFVWDLLSFVSA